LHLSKLAPQPLKESIYWRTLEPTNDGMLLQNNRCESCQAIRKQFNKDYVSLMPTNLYGTMIILI
jgi:GDP-L-fucose synthase